MQEAPIFQDGYGEEAEGGPALFSQEDQEKKIKSGTRVSEGRWEPREEVEPKWARRRPQRLDRKTEWASEGQQGSDAGLWVESIQQYPP